MFYDIVLHHTQLLLNQVLQEILLLSKLSELMELSYLEFFLVEQYCEFIEQIGFSLVLELCNDSQFREDLRPRLLEFGNSLSEILV